MSATAANLEALFTLEHDLSTAVMDAQYAIPAECGRDKRLAVLKSLQDAQGLISDCFLRALERNNEPLEIVRRLYEKKELRATTAHIEAVIGLKGREVEEQRVRKQLSSDQSNRGGYMYQPSDLYELQQVFDSLELVAGDRFLDAGSGYGHVLFLGAALYPEVSFTGIELIPERVVESTRVAKKLGLSNVSFIASDILSASWGDPNVIFCFNPFPNSIKLQFASQLEKLAQENPLTVIDYQEIVTRGSKALRKLSPDEQSYAILTSS
jgi:SAM-dependent methyltransferase